MRTESLTEAKNNLSRLIARVRQGERIRILSRGVPVADLVPVGEGSPAQGELEGRLGDLERKGLVRRGTTAIDPARFERRVSASGRATSAYLLDERRSGR